MKRNKKILIIIGTIIVFCFTVIAGYKAIFMHPMPYKGVDFEIRENLSFQFDIDASLYDRTGFAYYYIKSDQKDRNKCHEWIYYPNSQRSESFKIYKLAKLQKATDLVCANYNFETFMPENITAYLVTKSGERIENAFTQYDDFDGTITIRGKKSSFAYGIIPSYFYNFDWADLISMIPYLKEKHSSFYAGFVTPDNSMKIQYQGKTKYIFTGQKMYRNVLCDVFDVVVQDLEDKEGKIYIDSEKYDVIEINMELSDNPLYDSFKFTLQEKKQMTLAEWNEFIAEKTKDVL